MKRHFPGLHSEPTNVGDSPEGVFLVRVDRAYYRNIIPSRLMAQVLIKRIARIRTNTLTHAIENVATNAG